MILLRIRDCVIIVRSGHSLLSSSCPPARRVLPCRFSVYYPCGVTSPEQATALQRLVSYYLHRTSQPPPTALWWSIGTQLRVVTGDHSSALVSFDSIMGAKVMISDDLSISAGKSLIRQAPPPQKLNLLQALHGTRIVATASN